VGSTNPSHEESKNVYLIDFGITGTFLSSRGDHIKNETIKGFAGNLIFSSFNQFNGESKNIIGVIIYRNLKKR
jgi:hypothetical protein